MESTFEEEEEEAPFVSEEEVIIDNDDSNSDFYLDQEDDTFNRDISKLQACINTYSAYMYDYPAELNNADATITVDLPNYFLPLSLQAVYGFNVHPIVLHIEIKLKDYDWTLTPDNFKIIHPVYQNNFVGRPLIISVFDKFFSRFFTPKTSYRAETYLFIPTGTPEPKKLSLLIEEGFDPKSAERALVICSNSLEKARNFLFTGEMPAQQTEMSIEFSSCPLIYLILEFAECFLDLPDHCCICRAKMESGLKPTVCNSQLCSFQLINIGVGNSVVQEIQRDPLVADLLLSLFSTALSSKYLNPAPPNFIPKLANDIISNLPSMETMAKYQNDNELRQKTSKEALDLLRWVLLSNRSQIISIPKVLQLREFPNTFQFMALLSTPESEKIFKKLKSKFGSIFLWHGSDSERWHSILRNGLKNATGTDMQANGSALGEGIYFSKESQVSWGYCKSGKPNNYKRSVLGKEIIMIGLCEICNIGSDTTIDISPDPNQDPVRLHGFLKNHGWAHTLTMEKACVVRFLFVKKPNGSLFSVNTLKDPPKKIPTLKDLLDFHANSAI
ncbi:UBA/TS-N domain containing protein [Tritrichomonas foetus]|uniref:UBA/TS-N domain containing protein n=1 Tax=Tritrichomonas foetus TaxID=1144522 RepID=A0A1J4KL16_9EUKA|nr:UBA/TS-N domain containing protein [Tritrichomonas foetus]|eukprot:OHT10390.1 UBA/TS-N domain containing protein [Tritrichomonas foetus]